MAAARFTLGELARALHATLDGDPDRVVTGVAPLESAGPDDISFLTDPRYHRAARASRAGAFLAPEDAGELPGAVLRCPAPRERLVDLLALFHPGVSPPVGIDASARIDRSAALDPTVSVGPLVVIERDATLGARVAVHAFTYVGPGVQVGADSVLHPHVVLREGTRLGRRVVIHAGAVIGADGFGYAWDGHEHRKIPHVGGVVVEDDVEIGANTTIDRAMLGDTVVRRGAKIDNLVQVAHNVEVGEHSVIAAQSGISGSTRIGRGVMMGGQVGISDHLTVGDGAMLSAQAGVAQDVPAGEHQWGTPSRPATLFKRVFLTENKLPEMARRLRDMERRLEALERRSPDGAR